MSRHQKALARLQASPPPSNFTWDELVGVLKHLGYSVLNGKGSRRKFFHQERKLLIICHEPHPSSIVDKGCIVDVVEHLRANGLLQGKP